MGFDHRTSREGDPLLHTHLVIANRIRGPDGRWTALDGRDLYRPRLAADAIYRATYQGELVRTLGVEWTAADGHGNRELRGMPEDLIRGFSKRTGQIDAELDRLGADGRERTPRLVKWTVQATRKPKQHEPPDALYGRWRAERDRMRRQLYQAPWDRSRELARAMTHRQQAEQALAALQQPTGRERTGMLGWLRRSGDQPAQLPGGLAVATQQANRAHDRERELRQHQQRRQGWLEANAHLGPQYRQVVRTLAWQRRATGLAVEADRPGYVLEALGPIPESTRGRRAWRQAAAQIEDYRRTYQITDPDRALGPEPRDQAQRADRQRVRIVIDRIHAKQRATDRTRERQSASEPSNQPRPPEQRGRRGPERAANSTRGRSTRWPVFDRGPSTTMTGPAARCGRSARPTSRPSSLTWVTTPTSCWPGPVWIGRW